jgi:hypothetical protein
MNGDRDYLDRERQKSRKVISHFFPKSSVWSTWELILYEAIKRPTEIKEKLTGKRYLIKVCNRS